VVIAEHRRQEALEECYGALERTRILKRGDAALSFYAVPRGGMSASPGTSQPTMCEIPINPIDTNG
jgi:hypothetical protein